MAASEVPGLDLCSTELLTNADLEKLVDTTDEWILQRTGIRSGISPSPASLRRIWRRRPARAIEDAGSRPEHRLHRRLHDHAGHDVSEHGVPGAA